jgi:adenosylhomocysteinase
VAVVPAEHALHEAHVVRHEGQFTNVPKDIDDEIARLKLETMGISIDQLTEEQARYLASWDEGT